MKPRARNDAEDNESHRRQASHTVHPEHENLAVSVLKRPAAQQVWTLPKDAPYSASQDGLSLPDDLPPPSARRGREKPRNKWTRSMPNHKAQRAQHHGRAKEQERGAARAQIARGPSSQTTTRLPGGRGKRIGGGGARGSVSRSSKIATIRAHRPTLGPRGRRRRCFPRGTCRVHKKRKSVPGTRRRHRAP